jgi:two-component system response regulator FixJ
METPRSLTQPAPVSTLAQRQGASRQARTSGSAVPTPPPRGAATAGGRVCRTLYLVHPDPEVHVSLAGALPRHRYSLMPFASLPSLLAAVSARDSGVLILDLAMEGLSALELLAELGARDTGIKVIVLSAEGGVPLSVRAMKSGAVDVLEKPCGTAQLLESLETAFALVEMEEADRLQRRALQARCERLTTREREVMHHIVRGLPNRRVAARLGVSERTVELYRARVMAKMEADSLPELVRMACLCSDGRPGEALVGGFPLSATRREASTSHTLPAGAPLCVPCGGYVT